MDIIKIRRVVEYVGPRDKVEAVLANSVGHGVKEDREDWMEEAFGCVIREISCEEVK